MDFGLAFTFPFQDEKWIGKILIAAVISIIPIIGLIAVLGWSIEIGRRVIQGEKHPLPDWGDFMGLLTLGFKGFLVALIFSIPVLVLSVPIIGISVFAGSGSDDVLVTIVGLLVFCASCLILLYSIVLVITIPAAFGRLAATDSIAETLNVRELWNVVNSAPGAYLIVVLGYIVAGFIGGLGAIFCGVGLFVTMAYALAVEGHLFGQAYVEGTSEA